MVLDRGAGETSRVGVVAATFVFGGGVTVRREESDMVVFLRDLGGVFAPLGTAAAAESSTMVVVGADAPPSMDSLVCCSFGTVPIPGSFHGCCCCPSFSSFTVPFPFTTTPPLF